MEVFLGLLIFSCCFIIIRMFEKIINPKSKITYKEDNAIKNIIKNFISEKGRPLTEKEVQQIVKSVRFWKENKGHSPLMIDSIKKIMNTKDILISDDEILLDTIIWKEWKKEYPDIKNKDNIKGV